MDNYEAILKNSSSYPVDECSFKEEILVNPRETFINEIRLMMQASGDIASPLHHATEKMNKFVYDQISLFLHLATKVAEERKSPDIGIEEFMFLLRKNRSRLFHLIRHLQFRDSKYKLPSIVTPKEKLLYKNQFGKEHKRSRIALQFLTCIDSFDNLATSFLEGEFDDIRIRKLRFAELFTRNMNLEQYSSYCQSRQMSFSKKLKKFSNWLEPVVSRLPICPNKYGWECLAYLALETVTELMYLTLLVRTEQCVTSKEKQHCETLDNFLLNENEQLQFPTTPKHIDEALRRFFIHYEPPRHFFTSENQILSAVGTQPILLLL